MGTQPPPSDGTDSGLRGAGDVPSGADAQVPRLPSSPGSTGQTDLGRSPQAHIFPGHPGTTKAPADRAPTLEKGTGEQGTGEQGAGEPATRELAASGHRARALKARLVAILRLAQLLPWPISMFLGAGIGIVRFELAVGVYAVVAIWSLIWVTMLFSRMELPRWSVLVDTAVVGAALVLAPLACYPLDASGWANAALAPALGTAVAAGLGLRPPSAAAAAVLLPAAMVPGVLRTLAESGPASTFAFAAALANAGTVLLGVLLSSVFSGYLDRQAAVAERAAAKLDLLAEAADRETARGAERVRQYRMLHDTVLSTLSAIARGVDPSDPLVRQRCAADADYLRSIIASEGLSNANRLQNELAAIGRGQAALGLRVHQHVADLPAGLPETVVRAIAEACREALNNVLKHSGTDQAWITAVGNTGTEDDTSGDGINEDGTHHNGGSTGGAQITVTVTDRGRGFDPASAALGLGLQQSIIGRMREAGGQAFVDSSPGHGTTVELQWPG